MLGEDDGLPAEPPAVLASIIEASGNPAHEGTGEAAEGELGRGQPLRRAGQSSDGPRPFPPPARGHIRPLGALLPPPHTQKRPPFRTVPQEVHEDQRADAPCRVGLGRIPHQLATGADTQYHPNLPGNLGREHGVHLRQRVALPPEPGTHRRRAEYHWQQRYGEER